MSDWMPWEGEEGNERKVAQREMFLPPHLQMYGNKRLLRDAILAVKMLGMPKPPPRGVGEQPMLALEWEMTKRNQRIIMERKAKFLKEGFDEDVIRQCEEAANEMLHNYFQRDLRKQADNYTSPKKHRGRLSEAEFKATVKRRNIREKKFEL